MIPLVNLTMKEFERVLKFFFWFSFAIAVLLMALRYFVFENPLFKVLSSVPSAVAIAGAITLYVLHKPLDGTWLAKLLRRKQIHGLWFGYLTSNYGADQGKAPLKFPIAFVIRQTYLGYSLTSYTKDMDGYSQLESLTADPKTGLYVLRYVFELRRTFAAENKLTQGSGELRLQSGDSKLVGFYWTNSPTQGQAELEFVQRDCAHIDNFADAEAAFKAK